MPETKETKLNSTYPSWQLFIAIFFGSPIVSFFLIGENWKALGEVKMGLYTKIAGFVLMTFIVVLAVITPDGRSSLFQINYGLSLVAFALQVKKLKEYRKTNTVNKSWPAWCIAVLILINALALCVFVK